MLREGVAERTGNRRSVGAGATAVRPRVRYSGGGHVPRAIRGAALLVAVAVLVASLVPDGAADAATLAHGGFTTTASASKSNAAPGETVTITARITSTLTMLTMVVVEVYGPTALRLDQFPFDNEPFDTGVERTFQVPWTVPNGAAAGGYTVKLIVMTPNWGQTRHTNDSAAFFTVGMATPPPAGGPVRIMPLGDGLTDGTYVDGGYRIDLFAGLRSAGLNVDFVGSRHNGVPGLDDKHHEGHPGWRIDELATGVAPWLTAYQPQIVLLLVGTHDMTQNHRPPRRSLVTTP